MTSIKLFRHSAISAFVIALATAALLIPDTTNASSAGAKRNAQALFEIMRLKGGLQVLDTFHQGLLPKGKHILLNREFIAGNDYVLVAGGCEDAYDVDIAVFDENGNLVSKDTDNQKVAVAKFSPKWTGKFHIMIKMYNSTSNGAHWVLQTGYKRSEPGGQAPEQPSEPSTSGGAAPPSNRESL